MPMMFEAVATDFPFVAELPKREKSKWRKAWDAFQEVQAVTKVEGTIFPQVFVAKVLDLSTARICQLCNEGKLRVVVVGNNRFVTERSVLDWAETEHKAGRPLGKFLDPMVEGKESVACGALRAGVEAYREGKARQRQAKESSK
jgi:hypothetical protein